MDSRKALFAILGGLALTTLIRILYRDSSGQKNIAEKAGDYTDAVEETIKESVANVNGR